MKVAFLQVPKQSTIRGVNFYSDRLFANLQNFSDLEISIVPFNPLSSYGSFNLVHSPFFEPYFFSLPIMAKPKVILTIHDATRLVFPDQFPSGPKGRFIWKIQKTLLNKVSHIITDSETSQKDISRLYPWPIDKITPVYLAADRIFKPLSDKNKLDIIRTKYHLPEKFLLYVSGANWNKNVLTLCQAANKLNFPLVIVGQEWTNKEINVNNFETRPLQQIWKYCQRKSQFIFPGFIPSEDLMVVYNLATVYVQPSIYEGFGLPVLEAMSCGTPVICGQNSSLKEITSGNVVYANIRSVVDISQNIQRILNFSSSQLSDLKSRELKQARKFSWEKTAGETFKIYQKVLHES